MCRGAQGRVGRALSARPMVWLGELSFGTYLWHLPVMLGLRELLPQAAQCIAGSLLALGAALVLTLLPAALSFYGVERPTMKWGRR